MDVHLLGWPGNHHLWVYPALFEKINTKHYILTSKLNVTTPGLSSWMNNEAEYENAD